MRMLPMAIIRLLSTNIIWLVSIVPVTTSINLPALIAFIFDCTNDVLAIIKDMKLIRNTIFFIISLVEYALQFGKSFIDFFVRKGLNIVGLQTSMPICCSRSKNLKLLFYPFILFSQTESSILNKTYFLLSVG